MLRAGGAATAERSRIPQTRIKKKQHIILLTSYILHHERYYRTMNNLLPALRQVDNAYLFDNSSGEAKLFATKENGELKVEGTYVP